MTLILKTIGSDVELADSRIDSRCTLEREMFEDGALLPGLRSDVHGNSPTAAHCLRCQ